MANPHKGEVDFEASLPKGEGDEVETKTYRLRFSTDAICQLEEKLDRSFVSVAKDLELASTDPDKIRFATLRAIFWAGLQEHHPEVDLKIAGDLIIAAGGVLIVMGLIADGFGRAFTAPKTKGPRPPKAVSRVKNGTGLRV